MQPVICIEMLYPGLSPVGKIENIAGAGFSNVEFRGWRDKDIPAIAEACRQNKVRVVNFSGHRRGSLVADMETAVSLIREINNPRLKILCDLYHLGVMGQDLKSLLTYYIDDIGHIHIADFPGRHEPGTGSADWSTLLTIIKNCGYQGFIGFEYSPLNDSYESLRKINSRWQRIVNG